MKFTLSTSGLFYPQDDRRKELEKIGFKFEPSVFKGFSIKGSPIIEINSLEELIKLSDQFGDLIVSDGSIEIYDDYRE